jgi:hypothetical protein
MRDWSGTRAWEDMRGKMRDEGWKRNPRSQALLGNALPPTLRVVRHHAPSWAFPPQAVFGPTFTSGCRTGSFTTLSAPAVFDPTFTSGWGGGQTHPCQARSRASLCLGQPDLFLPAGPIFPLDTPATLAIIYKRTYPDQQEPRTAAPPGGKRSDGLILEIRKTADQLSGPKAQPFAQPRATPWGIGRDSHVVGPTGQFLSERLARWADKAGGIRPRSPGRCPGLGEPMPLRGDSDTTRGTEAD